MIVVPVNKVLKPYLLHLEIYFGQPETTFLTFGNGCGFVLGVAVSLIDP